MIYLKHHILLGQLMDFNRLVQVQRFNPSQVLQGKLGDTLLI